MLSDTGSTETVVKYVVYRLSAIAAILFYWITMKAVQQLTGLTQAYYTGELLNTTQMSVDSRLLSCGVRSTDQRNHGSRIRVR